MSEQPKPERLKQSVTKKVIWRAHCTETTCWLTGWKGPERDTKWQASYDLAAHNTDRHGGAERIGAES